MMIIHIPSLLHLLPDDRSNISCKSACPSNSITSSIRLRHFLHSPRTSAFPIVLLTKHNQRILCHPGFNSSLVHQHQQNPNEPTSQIHIIQREFDSLFLRFLEKDIPSKIFGLEDDEAIAEQYKNLGMDTENADSDPIHAFLQSCRRPSFNSQRRGSPDRSQAGEIQNEPNASLSSIDEVVDLLRSIINIAKILPGNIMVADFLYPYIGRISHRDCNLLLQLLGEEGLYLQALHLLQWMRLKNPSLVTPTTYSIIFLLLGKAGMVEKLWALYRNMPQEREFHSVHVYNAMISGFSRSARYDDAWQVLEEMERDIGLDSGTCSSLITAMRKSGQNAKEAWQFFNRMSKSGVKLSSEIFGSLIKSFCNEGLTKEALIVLSEMEKHGFKPNDIIYNTLIDSYAKTNQLEEAEGLFLEMKERDVHPTVSTYNTLVDAYSKKGRHEVVEEIMEEMEQSGLKPDVWTFTYLLSAYGRQKKMGDKATDAFLKMRKQGLLPTSQSYTALIHVYSVCGWYEKTYITFEKMTREGLKPLIETYTTLLDCYRRAGDVQKLMEIWKMMMNDGIKGTRVTFNILVDGFAKKGRYREARDVIFEFGKMGLKPHVMTYNMLINAYARGGRLSKCPQVLNEMNAAGLKPDAYTYSTLIYAFFRVSDFRKAFYYHKEMIKNNQFSDSMSYAKMKSVLDLNRTLKSKRDRRAVLGRIRKQIGLPSRNRCSKEFWKNKERPTNTVTT